MLLIRSLQYNYPNQKTLVYPDIELKKQDSLLLKGPSGCGKSTLMYLISGLLPIQQGFIQLFDSSVTELSDKVLNRLRSNAIGLVFQRNHFLPALSVYENLRLNTNSTDEYIRYLADFLHIESLLKKKPTELSEGELQRAALVRALAYKPQLLIADEPTSNLDTDTCKRMIALLDHLHKSTDLTLLLITHDERLSELTHHEIYLTKGNT
jgi:putative ABC transport system ATP-binding protein